MASSSDKYRICGVKITATVKGESQHGSGFIYVNPQHCGYDYIFTVKHIFQELGVDYNPSHVNGIEISNSKNGEFQRLHFINQKEVKENLIHFEEDLAILKIPKNPNLQLPEILVSDIINDRQLKFNSWSVPSSDTTDLSLINYSRNDKTKKRFKIHDFTSPDLIKGISGSGLFSSSKNILYGIIYRYPHEDFQNKTIDCVPITFQRINFKLEETENIKLITRELPFRKLIKNDLFNLRGVSINNTTLNLAIGVQLLKNDMRDDWFHDPLHYIDLCTNEFIFNQLRVYFNGKEYKSTEAEIFFIPKVNFTLRQAIITPFLDKLIYISTVKVLSKKMDNALINNVYHARCNRHKENFLILHGVEQWKKMNFQLEASSKNHKYVLEIDILNFYDNINKKLLIKKLHRICENQNDSNAVLLLESILDGMTLKEIGLPQNSDASSMLATFYLNQIDSFVSNQVPEYFRFMDDIRIFCNSHFEARKILKLVETELRRCHLTVNSQKTKIRKLEPEALKEYELVYDTNLKSIHSLCSSKNFAHINQAFHSCKQIITDNFTLDLEENAKESRRVRFALRIIQTLAKRGLNISDSSDFLDQLILISKSLIAKPWNTNLFCKILNFLPKDKIPVEVWDSVYEIITDDRYNIYSWQAYHLWLILAKHKFNSRELIKYAIESVEKNDDTKRPIVASMLIYLCSVDENYRKILLRKFEENFTHGYFQNRLALITLRSFSPELVPKKYINSSLAFSPITLFKNKDKSLIFIPGVKEIEIDYDLQEQIYSL